MILIDTCVLIWLASDPDELSKKAAEKIQRDERVFVSAISAFEIGLKAARGLLTLPKRIDQWFPDFLRERAIEELSVTSRIALRATLLPPLHQDPFDRIIVATASVEGLTLLTPDPLIRRYPEAITIW